MINPEIFASIATQYNLQGAEIAKIVSDAIAYAARRNSRAAIMVSSRDMAALLMKERSEADTQKAHEILSEAVRILFASMYHINLISLSRSAPEDCITTMQRLERERQQYESAMTRVAQIVFPAYELILVYRHDHEEDEMEFWRQRWRKCGGILRRGRMIALKTNPIWKRISAFGLPYPPFAINSGVGVADVERDVCIKMGIPLPKMI